MGNGISEQSGNITFGKNSRNVLDDTLKTFAAISEKDVFEGILESMKKGEATVELRKRFLIRSIDEKWVRAIEDVLPSLEIITTDPRRYIENKEYVLPISQSKSITSRSIRHLAQHVDYIQDIKGDEVMPAKILNVFHEETLETYENKFVNTLIQRLWSFVYLRYTNAKETPDDTKSTKLTFNEKFGYGDVKAKINFSLELQEPAYDKDAKNNSAYTGDLWRRIQNIYSMCLSYKNSEFARLMGNATVRPPIIRTNAIMKNKYFRDCLALWEFLDSYDTVGYSLVADERLEKLDESYINDLYSTMAAEYMIFKEKINSEFDDDALLDSDKTDIPFTPKVVKDIIPTDEREFSAHIGLRLPNPELGRDLTELDHRILKAIDNSLDAARYLKQLERLRNAKKLYRSYMSRLIQGSDVIQGFYTVIKNKLLSYNNVTSTVRWTGENFEIGGNRYAIVTVKGKSLVLYLALNPSDYDSEIYHHKDMSGMSKYRNIPFKIRISNQKMLSLVEKLISDMFKGVTTKNEQYRPADFTMPYETDSQLIKEGLIRADEDYKIKPDNEINHKIEFINNTEKTADSSEKLTRSYEAKIIQSSDEIKSYYYELKNLLLAYSGVKSRVSRTKETFNKGRLKLACIRFRGKVLSIALPLDPDEYTKSKYHQIDLSAKGKATPLPFLLKIKSKRGFKYAYELLSKVISDNELKPARVKRTVEKIPYENDALLIDKGLIKVTYVETKTYESPYDLSYDYKFMGALNLAGDDISSWYSKIKNALLCHYDVHSKIGDYYETFTKGRNVIARLAVKEGILTCFLALDMKAVGQVTCPHKAFKPVEFLSETPMAVSITAEGTADRLVSVIKGALAEKFELLVDETVIEEDYSAEKKSFDELIKEGFVKKLEK